MKTASLVTAVLLALSGYAFAQDGEQTIALLPQDADLPDVVTAAIELPKDAEGVYRPSVKAVERSAEGIATANAAPRRRACIRPKHGDASEGGPRITKSR